MRTLLLLAALSSLAASCTTGKNLPGVRRTHEDRWREATEAYERSVAEDRERNLTSDAAGAVPRVGARAVPVATYRTQRAPVTIFEVQDLLQGVPSFTAPEIGLVAPSGGLDRDPAEITYTARMEPSELEAMIRASVAPGTWEEEGNSLEVHDGRLIVRRRD